MGGVVAALCGAGLLADELADFAQAVRLLDILQRDGSGLGLLGQRKLAARLRDVLSGDSSFSDLRLPLALVAVDMDSGEELIIQEGSIVLKHLCELIALRDASPRGRLGDAGG